MSSYARSIFIYGYNPMTVKKKRMKIQSLEDQRPSLKRPFTYLGNFRVN